jgi:hypothetical protein
VRVVLHNLITRIESYTFAIPVTATMGLARAKVWKTDEKAWNIGASVATPALGEPELRQAIDRLGVGNHFDADGIQEIHLRIAQIIGLWFAGVPPNSTTWAPTFTTVPIAVPPEYTIAA